MKISLVLSTYNGAKHIVDQLDSLRNQTRVLDEVLICDDASADATAEVIRGYIRSYGLDNWKITVNNSNKGWKRNFHELLRSATGDYIFLCDQDDIWLPNKVCEMADLMESHFDIDVLACDVEPFYEDGSKKVPNVGNGSNTGVLVTHSLNDKAVYILRPGCAYCVRNSFVREVEPYWDESWPHDAILWLTAEVKGSLALYDSQLVKFRRHCGNASARSEMTQEARIEDIEHLVDRVGLMKRFGADIGSLNRSDVSALDDIETWLKARILFLNTRSFPALVSVIRGRIHYATWKGLPVDCALAFVKGATL